MGSRARPPEPLRATRTTRAKKAHRVSPGWAQAGINLQPPEHYRLTTNRRMINGTQSVTGQIGDNAAPCLEKTSLHDSPVTLHRGFRRTPWSDSMRC